YRGSKIATDRSGEGDRRSADGWDERRRRSVRRRKNVPSAGGEKCACDEARRRLFGTVSLGEESERCGSTSLDRNKGYPTIFDRIERRFQRKEFRRKKSFAGHGERRCARHRQEYRGRDPRVQRLGGDRPRCNGACGKDPRYRERKERGCDRIERTDHAFAR